MNDTKERILTEATRLFAEKGFDGVSVREICRAADVNGALVNYHFRNKEGLYRDCLARLFARDDGLGLAALPDGVTDASSWRAALRCWILQFSKVMHSEAGTEGVFRQEVLRPSSIQPYLEAKYGIPVLMSLKRLIAMAVATPREVDLWVTSIWAQLSAHALVAPVWQKNFRPPGVTPDEWGVEFANFICEELLKGLKYRGVGKSRAARREAGR